MIAAALSSFSRFLRPRAATPTIPRTMVPAERGMLEPSLDEGFGRKPERELQLDWFGWLTRHRRMLYAIVAAFYILTFNGLWRVGVDSALYRGLARSMARGDGYVFAGEPHRHAYPGLPVMLAGIEKVFGDSPVWPLAVIVMLALATLFLIDRTIALRYPLWVATVVTIGVGLNYRLLRQSQQIMTDVPFTFGVMAALYGLERLRLLPPDARWPAFTKWAAAMISGLVVAAAMRPTFGVLAAAIVIGSAIRAARNVDRRRRLHVSILASALLVLLALFLADPRTRGFSPLQGVYEQELVERVAELPHTILGSFNSLFGGDLNDVFFSQHLWWFGYPATALVLIVGGWLVLRRDVVWGLMIFGLVAVTLPLSTVPRYFLMIAPLLWLGWTLLCCHVALRVPADKRGPVLAIALAFPLIVNVARSVGFVIEQRTPDVAWLLHGQPRAEAFYNAYRGGVVPKLQAIAAMIAANTTDRQTVIGPEAHVLAYYADRRVIGERTLFIDREVALSKWPKLVADAKADLAIFPASAYDDNDSLMRDLIRRRILVAELEVAQVNGTLLAVASVRPPPAGVNWRTYKAPAESTTREANGSTTSPTTKRGSTVRKGSATQRAELIAQRERRAEREAKIRRAEKAERVAKLERQARLERLEKQAKIERRERAVERAEKLAKIERRERIERKERIERQKKIAKKKKQKRASATTDPTTGPATR